MKLEIGSGKKPRKGYLTCDIRDMPNVDYVCTADKLPFSDEKIDEIYSRHVVEHFTLKEFLKVLEEWNRVLKINGEVYIICPNLLWHLEQILKGKHQSFYSKKSGRMTDIGDLEVFLVGNRMNTTYINSGIILS